MKFISALLLIISLQLTTTCHHKVAPTQFQFVAPWSDQEMQATNCRMWVDDDSLYFHFQCIDSSLISLSQDNFHDGIGLSDRVEIFMATDTMLSRYYGMELCFDGRILDFSGTYYRDIDYAWSWPNSALSTICEITKDGYQCQGAFNISYLKSIGVLNDDAIFIGVFRADYHNHNNPKQATWITAQDPQVPSPDFHIPKAFFKYPIELHD